MCRRTQLVLWHKQQAYPSEHFPGLLQSPRVQSLQKAHVSVHSGDIGYTAGTLEAIMHDCVQWVSTGKRALKQAQEANGVAIGATKALKRARCPLMPPLPVHHYRDEPRGRDCTYDYKNHSTA